MVRTQHFHCRGLGSIPGWETKIPQATSHMAQPKKKKKEEQDRDKGHITEIKNVLEEINSRFSDTEEWINSLEDKVTEITQAE